MCVRSLGQEDPLEKGMATSSSVLPRKVHGQRSLVGYSPWGHKDSDVIQWLNNKREKTTGYKLLKCIFFCSRWKAVTFSHDRHIRIHWCWEGQTLSHVLFVKLMSVGIVRVFIILGTRHRATLSFLVCVKAQILFPPRFLPVVCHSLNHNGSRAE